jgi:DNA-binding beta-propeller fold protein YncE
MDGSGNLYISEYGGHRIRKITPAGVVSTLAGSGNAAYADGSGISASFNEPQGLDVDASGNVYVVEANNNRIRKITPAGVLKLKVDDMRAAGLSARKVEYLVDLALHFSNGTVHTRQWADMDDEAIIDELVAIRGIGRWTAEMFLIFYLLRPNVLPLDDVGLINGISHNYFSGEAVSRSDAREVASAWAPYCSVATWYIWRSLDPQPVAY